MAGPEFAARLIESVATPLAVPAPGVSVDDRLAAEDWVESGAHLLTGYRSGPPLFAPGAPASSVRAALTVASACCGQPMPGTWLLSERARLAGWSRNAPFSVGGAFRTVRTADGWVGLSLARASDVELIPALVRHPVQTADPWQAVAAWAADRGVADITTRFELLGLPGAAIPAQASSERPGVVVTAGGARRHRGRPLVVDLTALWAGPLCARLLGLAGARVVKVESPSRPDGARFGPPGFFNVMHGGHEQRTIDLHSSELRRLIDAADVVLEASRPRALAHVGVDAASRVADGLIWVSITAYGRDSPMRVGFGDDVAAGAGLLTWVDGAPVPVGDAIADPLAGVHAAAAALLALRGDRGCLIDVSMHDLAAEAASTGAEGATAF